MAIEQEISQVFLMNPEAWAMSLNPRVLSGEVFIIGSVEPEEVKVLWKLILELPRDAFRVVVEVQDWRLARCWS